MGPSPSADQRLSAGESELLLDIADDAILEGLEGTPPSPLVLACPPVAVREPSAALVTLTVGGELNGCIGSLEAEDPLAEAVARHARSAAFHDPRLPALRRSDYARLRIEVSVLSALEPIPSASRSEVLDHLCPGTDGLLISDGVRRAVFLPSVWEQLPDPADFLGHLQQKARMAPTRWPENMRAWRFGAHKYSRPADRRPAPLTPKEPK